MKNLVSQFFLRPFSPRKEEGAILIFFSIFAVILIGMVSLSFYIGQQVKVKIHLQNSADAATLATANHAAEGLNMISANNLAIGGSLQVAASVPIAAAYASVMYAMTSDIKTAVEELVKEAVDSTISSREKMTMDRYQEKIWNKLAPVTALYLQSAAGTTTFNHLLAKYWMVPSLIPTLEIARLNAPGATALTVQSSSESARESGSSFFRILPSRYDGLEVSRADDAMCHTIRAARSSRVDQKMRDNVLNWLKGPIMTFKNNTVNQALDKVTKVVDEVLNILPVAITFSDCGWGLKSGVLSYLLQYGRALNANFSSPRAKERYHDAYLSDSATGDGDWRNDVRKVGLAKVPRIPFCDSRFHAIHSAIKLKELVNLKSDLNARYAMSELIRNIQKEIRTQKSGHSQYYCEIKDEQGFVIFRKFDHIPHVRADGTKSCIDVRNVDSACVYNDLVERNFSSMTRSANIDRCFPRILERIRNWQKTTCRDFDFFDDKPEAEDTMEVVDYGKQMRAYTGEIKLDQWGVETKTGKSSSRMRQIGLTYVKDREAFQESLKFLTVVANPVRSEAEMVQHACPDDAKMKSGVRPEKCLIEGLHDFAKISAKKEDNIEKMNRLNQLATSGMSDLVQSEKGALSGSWERSFWVLAASQVEGVDGGPREELFWPQYAGHLRRLDSSLLRSLMNSVLPPKESASMASDQNFYLDWAKHQ